MKLVYDEEKIVLTPAERRATRKVRDLEWNLHTSTILVVDMGEQYKEDPRFKNAFKEFLMMNGVMLAYSIAWFVALLTWGKNPYTVVLGRPWWFSLLFISIIFNIIVFIATELGIKEDSLSPWLKGGGS